MMIIYLLSLLCIVIVILILQIIKISISIYKYSINNEKKESKAISTIPIQSKINNNLTNSKDSATTTTSNTILNSSKQITSAAAFTRRDSRDIKTFNKYGLIPTKEFVTNPLKNPDDLNINQINNNIPLIAAGMRRKNLYVAEVDVYIVGIYMSLSKDTILSSISLQNGFKLEEYLSTPVISTLNSNNLTLCIIVKSLSNHHIIYIYIYICLFVIL